MKKPSMKICNPQISDASWMSKRATVSCGRCGAKAHDPANVCDPVQLPEAGYSGD